MSIFKYLFGSNWMLEGDIESLKEQSVAQYRDAANTNHKVDSAEARIQDLEEQVGALTLLVRTMHEMMRQSDQWSETTFRKLLLEIDMTDGKKDGKARAIKMNS